MQTGESLHVFNYLTTVVVVVVAGWQADEERRKKLDFLRNTSLNL